MTINEITYKIRGAVFTVYKELGPGLLESIYQEALAYQLAKDGLMVEREVLVPVIYDEHRLATDMRIDILVENKVVVELKAVSELKEVHKKQLFTYLKLSGRNVGLLINFNTEKFDKSSFIRIINGTIE